MENRTVLRCLLVGIVISLIVVPIIINCLYIPNGEITTDWSAGEILQYLGAALLGVATILIAWIAIGQSDNSFRLEKRMKQLELNAYSPKLSVCRFLGKEMSYTRESENDNDNNCFITKIRFSGDEDGNEYTCKGTKQCYGLGFRFQDDKSIINKKAFANQYELLFEYSSKLFVRNVFLESIRFLNHNMKPIYSLDKINGDMETSLLNEQKLFLSLSFVGNDSRQIKDSYLDSISNASKIEIRLRFEVDSNTDYIGIIMIRKFLDEGIEHPVTSTFFIEE